MRLVKSKNTSTELLVRKLCRDLGYLGYRLHRKDLPGKPDIAFIAKRKAIHVHGCFWHGHNCRMGIRKPKSNQSYWFPKIDRNRQRDADQRAELEEMGWSVLIIWECELISPEIVKERLNHFMQA